MTSNVAPFRPRRRFRKPPALASMKSLENRRAARADRAEIEKALAKCGVTLKSPLMRRENLRRPLTIALFGELPEKHLASSFVDVRKAARLFAPELEALDRLNGNPMAFPSGMIAAALIELTLHPNSITFFAALNATLPDNDDSNLDPVIDLRGCIADIHDRRGRPCESKQVEMCALTHYLAGVWRVRRGMQDPRFAPPVSYDEVDVAELTAAVLSRKRANSGRQKQ